MKKGGQRLYRLSLTQRLFTFAAGKYQSTAWRRYASQVGYERNSSDVTKLQRDLLDQICPTLGILQVKIVPT